MLATPTHRFTHAVRVGSVYQISPSHMTLIFNTYENGIKNHRCGDGEIWSLLWIFLSFYELIKISRAQHPLGRCGLSSGFARPRFKSLPSRAPTSRSYGSHHILGSLRRWRDLNSRTSCPVAAFRMRCLQPLSHISNILRIVAHRGFVFAASVF